MSNTLKRAAELLREGAYDCVVKCHHDEYIALESDLERMARSELVAWALKHQTMSGDISSKLSWSKSGAGVCERLLGEDNETPLYAAQQETVNQQMLAALQKVAGITMSMYSTQIEAIRDAKRMAKAAISAAESAK